MISQFDDPDGFSPVTPSYRGLTLETSTEQVLASGPPLGDLDQYLETVRERRLEDSPRSGGFSPNGRWNGDSARNLRQVPVVGARSRVPVVLAEPSVLEEEGRGFLPTSQWQGERQTGLLEFHPDTRRRPKVTLTSPSLSTNSEGFTPSSWSPVRARQLDSHPRNVQEEPDVITVDNLSDWLGKVDTRPDTFQVNVHAVINTRGAQRDTRDTEREARGAVWGQAG